MLNNKLRKGYFNNIYTSMVIFQILFKVSYNNIIIIIIIIITIIITDHITAAKQVIGHNSLPNKSNMILILILL